MPALPLPLARSRRPPFREWVCPARPRWRDRGVRRLWKPAERAHLHSFELSDWLRRVARTSEG